MREPPKPADERQRLNALRALGLLDSPREERFDRITRLAARSLNTSMALLTLVDERRQWFKSAYGVNVTHTSREISFCGHAILQPAQPLVVSDTRRDERFQGNPLVTGAPYVRFYAGVPVTLADGSAVGTLCVLDQQPRILSEQQLRDLQDFAALAQAELRRAAAEERSVDLFAAREQAEALLDASPLAIVGCDEHARVRVWNDAAVELLGVEEQESAERPLADSAPELDELLTTLRRRLSPGEAVHGEPMELTDAFGATRHLRVSASRVSDGDGQHDGWLMVLADVTHEQQLAEALEQEHEVLAAVLESIAVAVVACDNDGRLTLFNSQASEWLGQALDLPPEQWQERYRARASDGGRVLRTEELPLYRALHGERVQDQELVVLCRDGDERILSANGRYLRTAQGRSLGAVVVLHDVTRRKELEQVLTHQATHDLLTGLPNRSALMDRLDHAIARCERHGTRMGALFVDLNGFKEINDTLGHEAGDRILEAFAQRLSASVRATDTVARLAGDEFIVLAEDLAAARPDLQHIAEQVLDVVAGEVDTAQGPVRLSASVGGACYRPGDNARTLLARADQAMYRVKRGEVAPLCIDGGDESAA